MDSVVTGIGTSNDVIEFRDFITLCDVPKRSKDSSAPSHQDIDPHYFIYFCSLARSDCCFKIALV